MGLTYEWKLTGLKKQNTSTLTDVIVGTQWKVTGTDEDGYQGTFTGATPFSHQDLNNDGFVDYRDLNEELVMGWITNYVSGSNIGTNYMNHIDQQIQKQIDSVKFASLDVSEMDLPWSPTSGSATLPAADRAPTV